MTDGELCEFVTKYARLGAKLGVPKSHIECLVTSSVILQPKQLEMTSAANLCNEPDGPVSIGVGGARGGGKSFWLLTQVGCIDCQLNPGITCLWLRKQSKANKEQLERLVKDVLHHTPYEYISHKGIIVFPNGSQIIAGHFNSENDFVDLIGKQYEILALEEATTLTASKYNDIRTCLRSSKPFRPREYNTTNPGQIGHGWYKKRFIIPFRQQRETETRFVPALCQDNKHNDAGYLKILQSQTGWKRRSWLEGDWNIEHGIFFDNWRDDVHVLPNASMPVFSPGSAHQWMAAMDYGNAHYTVVLLAAVTGDGDIIIVDEHYARKELPSWHASRIRDMFSRWGVHSMSQLKYFTVGSDAFSSESDGTSVAATYKELGLPLTCANMDRANGWSEITRRLGDVGRNIRPSLYIQSRCVKLIEQLPQMLHDNHKPEDVLKCNIDEDGDGGDDFVDCLRYLVASHKQSGAVTFARALRTGDFKTGGMRF